MQSLRSLIYLQVFMATTDCSGKEHFMIFLATSLNYGKLDKLDILYLSLWRASLCKNGSRKNVVLVLYTFSFFREQPEYIFLIKDAAPRLGVCDNLVSGSCHGHKQQI